MNFTACIKSARIKPNYVLNVSIDIPLKSAKILSDRSHGGDFTFSPNRINLNKKMKLSIPTSSVPKTSRDGDSRKISSCLGDTQHTISGINKKKTIQSINSVHKKEKGKNKSCQVSPKKKTSIRDKQKKRKLAYSNIKKVNQQLQVLSKFVNEAEDNIIKYTNQSSQLKKESDKKQVSIVEKNERVQSRIQDLDIEQIRQYQKIATQRKQHLNYLYLKQKVLVLASVKKIQRAWRNYKTKKLLRSYSNNISLKFTDKMKNSLYNQSILTVRSLGNQFKKPKRQLQQIKQLQLKNITQQSIKSQKNKRYFQKDKIKEKKDKIDKLDKKDKIDKKQHNKDKRQYNKVQSKQQSLKQFQNKQIKKWQGKKVQDVLQNSLKRKQQLEKDLKKYKQHSWSNSFQQQLKQLKNSDKNNNDEGMTTQQRRKKLQFFESQIRKIDNQNSDINSVSQFDFLEGSRSNTVNINRQNQQIQNQKLKKKLQIFNQLQLLNQNQQEIKLKQDKLIQQQDKQSDININDNQFEYQSGQDKLQTHRINILQQQQKQINPIQQNIQQLNRNKNRYKRQVLSDELGGNFINSIIQELIYQIFLQISECEKIVGKMKNLFQNHNLKQVFNKKPQGICTNLQSIKDYLQNLVAFLFCNHLHYIEQHPSILQDKLNQPSGPTPYTLFKYIRDQPIPQINPKILPTQIFQQHWDYASQQIYFDPKYQDYQLQKNRVDYLKNLTKIYFRAIFQAFNQCLQPYRIYGLLGKPFPWKKVISNVQIPDARKTVRLAYKKLSFIAMVFCGLHLDDKKHTMSQQIIKQIQNERMNTLLQIQFSQNQYKWSMVDDEQAQILIDLSESIVQEILRQYLLEMNNIF